VTVSGYTKRQNGHTYEFNPDRFRAADWTERSNPVLSDGEFRTVAVYDLEKGESVALGRGDTFNPDKAEGFIHLDAQNDSAADIDGRVRLAVVNNQGEKVRNIYKNDLGTLREGSASSPSEAFPYQALRGGSGEVGYPYEIAIQIDPAAGSDGDTFDLSNSTLAADGYSGSRID